MPRVVRYALADGAVAGSAKAEATSAAESSVRIIGNYTSPVVRFRRLELESCGGCMRMRSDGGLLAEEELVSARGAVARLPEELM